MKYNKVRDIAKDGDIVFLHVNNSNLLSRLTAYITKSRLTHVAFVFWYNGRLLLAESTTHGGSRIATASHYKDRDFELCSAPVPWESITTEALTRSGESTYGWLSAIYIGIKNWLLIHANIKLKSFNNNKDKACSEYVAELLGLTDADISPQQLFDHLTNRN